VSKRKPRNHRHRIPPEIISYVIWLQHRFNLSFQGIEDLLAERGIEGSYESIRRWCLEFGPGFCRSNCGFDRCQKIETAPLTPTGAASEMRPVK